MMLELFGRKEFVIFTTRDYANAAALSLSAASKQLSRLHDRKFLKQITKGVWANTAHPYFHPLSCVPLLLGKEHGYVSFLTALHLHGAVSQIPATVQVATSGHSRVLESPVGRFEFLQIKPELMQAGVTWSETQLPFQLATPEKALFDVLYISTRKNRRFARLPELTLEATAFKRREFQRLMRDLPLEPRLRVAMAARLPA